MKSLAETLVHGEDASEQVAPFAALAEPDLEPIEGPTRVLTIWVGSRFAEIDPKTRKVIRRGKV